MELDPDALERYLSRFSGHAINVEAISALDGTEGAQALKAFNHGRPLLITFRSNAATDGTRPSRHVLLRQFKRNGFGRERDADRIAEVWQDWNTYGALPRHAPACDIVGLTADGTYTSLAGVADVLLLTDYLPGRPYADDLHRIFEMWSCDQADLARARALGRYLAAIHSTKHDDPLLWRRRLRDLVGHGEGIMGLCDSYPADFALAPSDCLRAIEDAANGWRWRLKPLCERLCQVHGDFHPFNVLFTDGESFGVIDRSRGAWGEAADDVSCMAINYLFYSLLRSDRLSGPFDALYRAFWVSYLELSCDRAIGFVIQPYFAWRALVLASPQWYPAIPDRMRRRLLAFARNVLSCDFVEWENINALLES